MGLVHKIFGTHSQHELKRIAPIADKVESYREEYGKLTDEQLKAKTKEFKERLAKGETLDDILPEAYATVREAGKRVLGMEHYRVQIIGGIILHQGRIAEMRTGEGKTLVCTLPAYLNALEEKGVLVVTVNDYLAKRDAEWMGQIHNFLGLSVGIVLHDMKDDERRAAYACDITYVTNNELGFDYLRDNMAIYKEQLVLRDLHYCIIDEVDSVLIDEARTPLIISGKGDKSTDLYAKADKFARTLKVQRFEELDSKEDMEDYYAENDIDYVVDEKQKTATLTQNGVKKAEEFFGIENLTDPDNLTIQHHVNQAIKAHGIMKLDVDYVVKDGEVIIVDEFTGRIMYGRRYNNGLHQAIEAKEHVKIADESKTLATITFQNYFRMYDKLSGMTGTAMTEESEFQEIYHLDVVSIPTNKPMIRKDLSDIIYKNENAKFRAVVRDVKESYSKGQPVLIGTVSIEKSEKLSNILKKEGIKHEVLNAKYHEKEAEIIAQAGKFGAVTIATNMAGRGTDIMLGGNSEYLAKQEMRKNKIPENLIEESNTYYETDDQEILRAREKFNELEKKYDEEIKEEKEKVLAVGGLKIIGTERHESRRIDNQLRGRSGRQGDPGESKFYIGLDDDLMKIFGGDMITKVYNAVGMDESIPIENKIISNAVESAQKKVEGRNFSIRKNVLKYDDVMNAQREIIYKQRRQVLDGENLKDNILNMIKSLAEEVVISQFAGDNDVNQEALNTNIKNIFGVDISDFVKENAKDSNKIIEKLQEVALSEYDKKEAEIGSEELRELERVVMLKVVDQKWMDHIDAMDELKDGIGLRAYGQQDPVVKYRIEGMDMFDEMVLDIKHDVVQMMMNLRKQDEVKREETAKITGAALQALNSLDNGEKMKVEEHKPVVNDGPKVGRNDPCPCGSGKKYKQCCGKNA